MYGMNIQFAISEKKKIRNENWASIKCWHGKLNRKINNKTADKLNNVTFYPILKAPAACAYDFHIEFVKFERTAAICGPKMVSVVKCSH